MTGIGAYIFITVIDHLVSGADHQDLDKAFAWPAPWASRSIFAGEMFTSKRVSEEKRD